MSTPKPHSLVGIGGGHVDRIGLVSGKVHAAASNPGAMMETVGGGMFNALRVVSMRGAGVISFVSARGGDMAGAAIDSTIGNYPINDLSGVFLDRASASYTAIHAPDGDVVAALADMDIYETALPRHIRRKPVQQAIASADWLMVDANMPEASIGSTVALADDEAIVCAMAISAAKAPRLLTAAGRIDLVFANSREAQAITKTDNCQKAAAALPNFFPHAWAVVTDGPNAVYVVNKDTMLALQPPQNDKLIDVTGAGDALAGGTIAALMALGRREITATALRQAVMKGIACAQCALSVKGPLTFKSQLDSFVALHKSVQTQNREDHHNDHDQA